jgi:hypothetical protein
MVNTRPTRAAKTEADKKIQAGRAKAKAADAKKEKRVKPEPKPESPAPPAAAAAAPVVNGVVPKPEKKPPPDPASLLHVAPEQVDQMGVTLLNIERSLHRYIPLRRALQVSLETFDLATELASGAVQMLKELSDSVQNMQPENVTPVKFQDQTKHEAIAATALLQSMPPIGFAHESKLLIEHGKRPSRFDPTRVVDAPACISAACQGLALQPTSSNPKWKGARLMIWMSENELAAFEETGAVPTTERLCLLCTRHLVLKNCLSLSMNEITEPSVWGIVHPYAVLDNCPDGYRREALISTPTGGNFNGMCAPFVHLRSDDYTAVFDAQLNKWTLDQTAIRWKMPSNFPAPFAEAMVGDGDARPVEAAAAAASRRAEADDIAMASSVLSARHSVFQN